MRLKVLYYYVRLVLGRIDYGNTELGELESYSVE